MTENFHKDRFTIVALLLVAVLIVAAAVNVIKTSGAFSTKKPQGSTHVFAWGADDSGQLGKGQLSAGAVNEKGNLVQLAGVKQVYGGIRHSLALTKDGSVMAWGNNQYGQMGNGHEGGNQIAPKKIEGLPAITMLATKQDHNLALDGQGRVWAWGLNMSGQLGDGTNKNRAKPQLVKGLDHVKTIATGYRSSIAVKDDGSVWTWGGFCNIDVRDKTLKDYIVQLSVGGYADGTGGTIDLISPEDDCVQEKYLNIKSYSPKKIEGLPPIEKISAGFGHVLAITRDGDLWSWGCNLFGQVGNSINGNSDANLTPAKIEGISHVKQVSAGFRHSLALTDDGKLWGWGHNYFGELGNGKIQDETLTLAPTELTAPKNVKSIYAGHDYTLATTTDGQLWGWGQASFGQLGSSEEYRTTPGRVLNLAGIETVAAGGAHGIVVAKTEPSKK